MADTLPEHSTDILGELLKISLNPDQAKLSKCDECGKACRSISVCEFCLANELYARRKTMAFMRLDLCVQAAVCLIAKVANQPKLRDSEILGVGYSKVFNESYIILDDKGDSNAD